MRAKRPLGQSSSPPNRYAEEEIQKNAANKAETLWWLLNSKRRTLSLTQLTVKSFHGSALAPLRPSHLQ